MTDPVTKLELELAATKAKLQDYQFQFSCITKNLEEERNKWMDEAKYWETQYTELLEKCGGTEPG